MQFDGFTLGAKGTFGQWYEGYIDEVRCRHDNFYNVLPDAGLTQSFTPPTNPFPDDVDDKYLLHCNSHDISADGGTGVYHIPTFNGTARVDTTEKVFGDSSFIFDGNSDYLEFPDSAEFDIFADNADDWTIDFRVKLNGTYQDQYFMNQVFDNDNRWYFGTFQSAGAGTEFLQLAVRAGGAWVILDQSALGTGISDDNWHHFLLCKKGQEYGIYLDGVQLLYINDPSVANLTAPLQIGQNGFSGGYLDGRLDEIRIQCSNDYALAPNVGLTNIFTPKPIPYAIDPSFFVPSGLVATKIDHRRISLSWNETANPAALPVSGYKIERELVIGGGWSTVVADTGNNLTTYEDTGLAAITQYNYRVSTISGIGTSDPSNEADDETDRYVWDETYAYIPFSTHGSDFSDISGNGRDFIGVRGLFTSSVSSWTLGKGVGTHGIGRGDNNGFSPPTIRQTPFALFADADDEWTISFYIRPKYTGTGNDSMIFGRNVISNPSGLGSWWWGVGFDKPNQRFNFRQLPGTGSEKLMHTGNNSAVDLGEYHLTIVKLKGNTMAMYLDGVQVAYSTSFNTVSETGSHLLIGAMNFYGFHDEYIMANGNIFGAQPNVGVTDIIPIEYQLVPTKPLALTADTIEPTEVTLVWTTPDFDGGSPITGYRIERESPTGGGFSVLVADTGNTDTTYVDSTLVEDDEYNYRVYALSSIGRSGQSNELAIIAQFGEDGIRWNKVKAIHEHVDPTKDWDLDKFSGIHCKNYDKL